MCKKLWLAVGAVPCACPVCKNGQPQGIAPISPCNRWCLASSLCVAQQKLMIHTDGTFTRTNQGIVMNYKL